MDAGNPRRPSKEKKGDQKSEDQGDGNVGALSSKVSAESIKPIERNRKTICRGIVENTVFSTLMTLLTVFALFGDDVKMLTTDQSADLIFNIITLTTMFMFGLEIMLQSIGKDGYHNGFFYWLDIISTVSLPLDVTWLTDVIFQEATQGGQGEEQAEMARAGRASRAGTRAGRVIRIIRLVRLIRIVKLYKHGMERVHKNDEGHRLAPGEGADADFGGVGGADQEGGVVVQSRVGKKLSELTTRRVIMIVLLLLCAAPILDPSAWRDDFPKAPEHAGAAIAARWDRYTNALATSPGSQTVRLAREAYEKALIFFISFHYKDSGWLDGSNPFYGSYICWLQMPGALSRDTEPKPYTDRSNGCTMNWDGRIPIQSPIGLHLPCDIGNQLLDERRIRDGIGLATDDPLCDDPENRLRRTERSAVIPHPDIMIWFNQRAKAQVDAILSIGMTIFICIVLAAGAMMFSKDANDLVLDPLERMITKMDKIRDNPLAATKLADDDGQENPKRLSDASGREIKIGKFRKWMQNRKRQKVEPLETIILEKTIIKLGGLLALGFGEAGAEIIGNNIKGSDMSFQGRKMLGIFGFCDIRNFTDATEVLQDGVMVFVNQIAEIVHSRVEEFSGAANKNIGDAFLLVWSLNDVDQKFFWKLQFQGGLETQQTGGLKDRRSKKSRASTESMSPDGESQNKVSKAKQQQVLNDVIAKMADLSCMSFLKVIIAINKSPVLAEYRSHPGLTRRMPGYKVKMGFGLHVGWAIEGPIGSEFKIDASYLSPNVNMSSRLEAATKQYETPLLISGSLVERMTPEFRGYCRRVDCVRVKGSNQPMDLWVVDLDSDRLKIDATNANEHGSTRVKSKAKTRQARELAKTRMWFPTVKIHEMFTSDPDLILIREHIPDDFLAQFNLGFSKYESGDWQGAREILMVTQSMLGKKDGPSTTLLEVMKEHFFISPQQWQGVRDLTEK